MRSLVRPALFRRSHLDGDGETRNTQRFRASPRPNGIADLFLLKDLFEAQASVLRAVEAQRF